MPPACELVEHIVLHGIIRSRQVGFTAFQPRSYSGDTREVENKELLPSVASSDVSLDSAGCSVALHLQP